MRKALLLTAALAALLALGAFTAIAVADPPPSPPGQGECEHGNSGKDCKPDPQPGHGKDCEEHGPKEGGQNEDHCDDVTTSTTTETETTTSTTQTTTTGSTTSPSSTSTPSQTSTEMGTSITAPASSGGTSGTTETAPANEPTSDKAPSLKAAKLTRSKATGGEPELPFTGFPAWAVALLGSAMLATGLGLRRVGRKARL